MPVSNCDFLCQLQAVIVLAGKARREEIKFVYNIESIGSDFRKAYSSRHALNGIEGSSCISIGKQLRTFSNCHPITWKRSRAERSPCLKPRTSWKRLKRSSPILMELLALFNVVLLISFGGISVSRGSSINKVLLESLRRPMHCSLSNQNLKLLI